jgi:hypothetical protein
MNGSWANALPLIVAAITAIGGVSGIAALFMVSPQRRKMTAESDKVMADTAVVLLAPLRARVMELEGKVSELTAALDASIGRERASRAEAEELRLRRGR